MSDQLIRGVQFPGTDNDEVDAMNGVLHVLDALLPDDVAARQRVASWLMAKTHETEFSQLRSNFDAEIILEIPDRPPAAVSPMWMQNSGRQNTN